MQISRSSRNTLYFIGVLKFVRISFLFQNDVVRLQLLQFLLKFFVLILQWYDQLICTRRACFGFKILNFKAADFFDFSLNKSR